MPPVPVYVGYPMWDSIRRSNFKLKAALACIQGDTQGVCHVCGLSAPAGYGGCRFCNMRTVSINRKMTWPDEYKYESGTGKNINPNFDRTLDAVKQQAKVVAMLYVR